jgi:hypothetical protein
MAASGYASAFFARFRRGTAYSTPVRRRPVLSVNLYSLRSVTSPRPRRSAPWATGRPTVLMRSSGAQRNLPTHRIERLGGLAEHGAVYSPAALAPTGADHRRVL